ncbi:response regulator [Scytonema sp. UIC 10036]|uniref:hybrid sensor histidine kinase/response regulator n=1 Tax=Scytonema sp. UIC 10036 TaxID=2304196 RepID=UPI0012DA4D82|nr:ATP-binding protein [Scytonema sp. UIC 10036]MUG93407.1 response regulator [Scytonema sp. UIC 10036]
MANAKILIVEDERIVAKDIAKRLQNLGYVVVAAVSSGEEAIEKAAETRPDLVLMDIRLKGKIDGIKASEHIRTEFNIPVIFLTAYADEKTLQRAKVTEPFGYIIKPFDERELYAAIEVALRRRMAEEAVHVALTKEKELSELKSRFWSMVVHEFRRPMTSILASAQLLEHHSHELLEVKKREYLYLIQESVRTMENLLNDVLAVGKAEGGQLDFSPAPLDLDKFCQGLVEEMQFSADQTHHIIFINHDQCTTADLDKKLLWHILSNLLSNAIKYSSQGSNVYLELFCPDREIIFQVKDTGIGIPTAEQQYVFKPFHRGENVGKIPGTGLGLTLVKKCLDLHGGEIIVQSEVGVGTTFTVKFPFRNPAISK